MGEHLKTRRRELGLLQREAAERMGIQIETYANWEKGKTQPVAAHFRPVVDFRGYDPTPEPKTLAERLEAKRRTLGATFDPSSRILRLGRRLVDTLSQWDLAHFIHQTNLLGSIPLR